MKLGYMRSLVVQFVNVAGKQHRYIHKLYNERTHIPIGKKPHYIACN
jgi:hypothetical protein